mmetsp:Transcript_9858/g.27691  ORF Transcript_9858/g.27691 Transcript_9858/m.27691 type:complete len:441 (+) Transcript_9858:102-1424(+)|eukprot:CAMPEP_0119121302 /NCGR_PEP_ID=MMETSP1310-20130426/2001_1 /TAXON_ID=464262 /ORGANISM="Genus nov. species nov., Strain RCC2339" /LENGTH=440 /DNA_ID=CAMNT_0007110865 /DNA_START=80 /DNA_END=1402 /DNA_ORIENTATION=-
MAGNSQQSLVAPERPEKYGYQYGFGNTFVSEARPDAVPKTQNNPQKAPFGLYAEQLSGTAFTVPRKGNQRTWLYRMQPGVTHHEFKKTNLGRMLVPTVIDPNQKRWEPFPIPEEPHTFVEGLVCICGAGGPETRAGIRNYIFTATLSMEKASFYNSDGDFLIVPQEGSLDIQTEMGFLEVRPGEICVIQRGISFAVRVEGPTRGYICEVYGHFQLPDLGPIGANGLANTRDFMHPVAAHDPPSQGEYRMYNKFMDDIFVSEMDHSSFNVVGWWGNYVPYKYDLKRFSTMNSVAFDHPDPSIFTVLTCPTTEPGVAACDFVIFPQRWMVAEGTFRPPYFHRNCMAEFMGLIYGSYDAKEGFRAGGASLHNFCTPHGPDTVTYDKASTAELSPERYADTLAFMFETSFMLKLTDFSANTSLEPHYPRVWHGLTNRYEPEEEA